MTINRIISRFTAEQRFIISLVLLSVINIIVYLATSWYYQSLSSSFLIYNLALSWIPLIISLRLKHILKTKLWSSWEALSLSALWMIFLPNAFYMISDFIHLYAISQNIILYEVVVFTFFILTAINLGYLSLYIVHLELRKRLDHLAANTLLSMVIFMSSSAIYVGRDLRWSSWNIFTNPGGLLFDISDRLLRPTAYPGMLMTILLFFILIISLYALIWWPVVNMRSKSPS